MLALELDIKTIRRYNGVSYIIKITEQRLRGVAAKLTTSNGFTFKSLSSPAIGVCYNDGSDADSVDNTNRGGLLYLQGSSRDADNRILRTSSIGYVNKLKVAVKEYNIVKAVVG